MKFLHLRTSLCVLAMTAPLIARAEPAASLSHLPFLWLLAIAAAALGSWLLVLLISRSGYLQTTFRKWGLIIILFVVFLVFLSPLIVGLGSILITGRTM